MHLADLVFLAAALATVITVGLLLSRLVRGQSDAARRLAIRWGSAATAYFAVLVIVSLVQPGRVVPLGQDKCFDDWCIAVTGAEPRAGRLDVTLHIANRGRGRTQAEPDAYVYLRDDEGREFAAVTAAAASTAAAVGDQVPAGQVLVVHETFDVPAVAPSLALVKARRARLPGNVIIGDPTSLLHRPTLHALASLTAASRER